MELEKTKDATNRSTQQCVVVVLGVGRSGTSVVTRAVQALGVELGNNLRPAGGKNPTGFFEDEMFLSLTRRVRNAVGLKSESVSLIEPQQWQSPAVQDLQKEAVANIRRDFGHYPLWGFKHGRTLRLLPFWLSVFETLNLDVRYVMALRNPLSVTRSRGRLDPLRGAQTKGDLEWLANVVPYFRRAVDRPLVVVDYDILMAQPVAQLERMSAALNLPKTAEMETAIQDYANNFLTPTLQHTRFTVKDLDDPKVNGLTRDAYRWLHRLATGEISLDAPALWQDWERIERAVYDLAPILRHIDQLEAELRRARRSLLGPLQGLPQSWLNVRQNWSLTRVMTRLRTAMEREAS